MSENAFRKVVLELRYRRGVGGFDTYKELYSAMGLNETQGGRYFRGDSSPPYAKAVEMYCKVGYEITVSKIAEPDKPKKLTQTSRPNRHVGK